MARRICHECGESFKSKSRGAFCDRCAKPLAIAATGEEAEAVAAQGVCVSFTDYGFHPMGPEDGEPGMGVAPGTR